MSRFCEENDLPFVRCGKVVVAADATELPALEEIHRRGLANGVQGLRLLAAAELREVEPLCRGLRGLLVPGAAITDYAAVTRTLARLVGERGGEVRTGARVLGIATGTSEVVLETTAGGVAARFAVNCAGLHADRLARLAGADPGLRIVPFRGEYYELAIGPSRAVRGLVYPVPDPALPFLGVHLTKRPDGSVLAGPNAVLALKREGYRRRDVALADLAELLSFGGFWRMAARHWKSGLAETGRSLSRGVFLRALRRLAPDLRAADLRPAGTGVRAQAVDRSGILVDDFRFVPAGRMVHVLNVPSPAATASLVIGAAIVDTLASSFGLGERG